MPRCRSKLCISDSSGRTSRTKAKPSRFPSGSICSQENNLNCGILCPGCPSQGVKRLLESSPWIPRISLMIEFFGPGRAREYWVPARWFWASGPHGMTRHPERHALVRSVRFFGPLEIDGGVAPPESIGIPCIPRMYIRGMASGMQSRFLGNLARIYLYRPDRQGYRAPWRRGVVKAQRRQWSSLLVVQVRTTLVVHPWTPLVGQDCCRSPRQILWIPHFIGKTIPFPYYHPRFLHEVPQTPLTGRGGR
jgi:hypothetical protein